MRLLRVSLAAKYRLLFGLAVALIIGAALYVPWYQMDPLLLEPLFRASQQRVDEYFRYTLPHPGAAAGRAAHSTDLSLTPQDVVEQPRYVRLNPDAADPNSIYNRSDANAFAFDALRSFRKDPKRDFFYKLVYADGAPRFYYSHGVRVTKSCLDCHDEGKTAMPFRENQLAGIVTVALAAEQTRWNLFINRVWIIAAGALAGILAILVFYIISRRFILSPIHELREVAARVGEGDLSVRSALQTGDEFEQLSASLNDMLERLRASQEDLKRANRLLDEKLGQMAETNVSLYESNRLKSEFLGNVSHELRTPLTSIIGFAELLREGPAADGDARTSRYAENILISGRILLEIINDLLDLAKIEAGRIELHLDSVDVRDLCQTLIGFMRPMADKKNLQTDVQSDYDLPVIQTDRSKLRQVLFNLLSNALKFTPEGGVVRLLVRRADERIRVEVTDSGPGVALEHQQLIFEKFRQIDQSATREHAGTGLGLAIAKELTMLLGGQIGVLSEPGHGATFWIELPIGAPQPTERPPLSLV